MGGGLFSGGLGGALEELPIGLVETDILRFHGLQGHPVSQRKAVDLWKRVDLGHERENMVAVPSSEKVLK